MLNTAPCRSGWKGDRRVTAPRRGAGLIRPRRGSKGAEPAPRAEGKTCPSDTEIFSQHTGSLTPPPRAAPAPPRRAPRSAPACGAFRPGVWRVLAGRVARSGRACGAFWPGVWRVWARYAVASAMSESQAVAARLAVAPPCCLLPPMPVLDRAHCGPDSPITWSNPAGWPVRHHASSCSLRVPSSAW
jgi:hypothetical protein